MIEFHKTVSKSLKSGRIKECFYHKQDECKGPIKQSHSIQRNGRLSLIEGEVSGNEVVYTFTSHDSTPTQFVSDLVPIGKGKASTFFGFCDFHDSMLFAAVENNGFDGSDEHLFLHSYRSFAHSFHRKREESKGHDEGTVGATLLPQPLAEAAKEQTRVALMEGQEKKRRLDKMIEACRYDELCYVYDVFDQAYPIACSSIITPDFLYSGEDFNNHLDPGTPYEYIMLTVLPDQDSTLVILACFPEEQRAVGFLEELEELGDHQFKVAISSLMITYVENTFFSPMLWEALGERGRKQLLRELGANFSTEWKRFRKCRTNFFAKHLATHEH